MDSHRDMEAIKKASLQKTLQLEGPLAEYCKQKLGKSLDDVSKNARKKLLKELKWDLGKDNRLALRKQKRQEYRTRKADRKRELEDENADSQTSAPASASDLSSQVKKPRSSPADQKNTGISIVLDLAFDDLMRDHEITSITGQVMRCYSLNKACENYVNLFATKFNGRVKDRFEKSIREHVNWDSRFISILSQIDYLKVFAAPGVPISNPDSSSNSSSDNSNLPQDAGTSIIQDNFGDQHNNGRGNIKPTMPPPSSLESSKPSATDTEINQYSLQDIVYLTADSDNIIEALEPSKLYIIGGIVDKNRYPGLTLKKAQEQGVSTGRLPIDKYLQMSTRKVLTVNHVFEIMLEFIRTADWEKSFLSVIPQRKFKYDEALPPPPPKQLQDSQ